MSRRGLIALFTAVGTALAFPTAAAAHGIVGRTDLPIPAWLFGWAASLVLIASFAALGALWPRPRLQHPPTRPLFRVPVAVDVVVGAFGIFLFVVVVYAGLAGSTVSTANLAPTFVYVHFWVGLVVLSLVLGDVFGALSPWRSVARAVVWVVGRMAPDLRPEPVPWPARLGRWPAALVVLGFGWLELAAANRDDPRLLAVLALAYAVVQLVGMTLFGIETWTDRADGFAALYRLYARLAPLARRPDRTLVLRPPLAGAPALELLPGTVALLAVAVGTTTFDGFSNGPVWASLSPHLNDALHGLGLGYTAASEWSSTVGLLACVALIGGLYRLGVRGVHSVDPRRSVNSLAQLFVHSLIPIAAAYALAHYFSLLVFQGQAAGYLASDPLGNGANLFGTAGDQINYALVSTKEIWYVQVAALVAGHVGGLVLAHDRAVSMYRDIRQATRSQYWMLAIMVGFTSLGLWLLSTVNS